MTILARMAEKQAVPWETGDFGPLQVLRHAFEARGLPPPRIALVSDLVMFKVRAVADSDLVGIAVRANLDAA